MAIVCACARAPTTTTTTTRRRRLLLLLLLLARSVLKATDSCACVHAFRATRVRGFQTVEAWLTDTLTGASLMACIARGV